MTADDVEAILTQASEIFHCLRGSEAYFPVIIQCAIHIEGIGGKADPGPVIQSQQQGLMSGGMFRCWNGDDPAVVEQIRFPVEDLPFLFREGRKQLFSGGRFDFFPLEKTGDIAQICQSAAMVAMSVGKDQM